MSSGLSSNSSSRNYNTPHTEDCAKSAAYKALKTFLTGIVADCVVQASKDEQSIVTVDNVMKVLSKRGLNPFVPT
jgi:hypothetical protein